MTSPTASPTASPSASIDHADPTRSVPRYVGPVRIPAGDAVPATRRVRGADLAPGAVLVQWSPLTDDTALATVTRVGRFRDRVTYETATGGHGSTLPDAWVQILDESSATATAMLTDLRATLYRWESNLEHNAAHYRAESAYVSESRARTQLDVVRDVLDRLGSA